MLLWFLVLRIAFYEIFPNLQCSSAVGVFCIQITDMVGGGGGGLRKCIWPTEHKYCSVLSKKI